MQTRAKTRRSAPDHDFMGRLPLTWLLSFAQFEREFTSERIRTRSLLPLK